MPSNQWAILVENKDDPFDVNIYGPYNSVLEALEDIDKDPDYSIETHTIKVFAMKRIKKER